MHDETLTHLDVVLFPPFRLDLRAGILWRGAAEVPLRPKAWSVLRYLIDRPLVLVPRDELAAAVWGAVTVTDDTVSQTIRELRHALQDDARDSRLIQTVHGRGFRFIAPHWRPDVPSHAPNADAAPAEPALFVGRHDEISTLMALHQEALSGHRQTVFLSGEAGIGKTALIARFVGRLRALHGPVRVAFGLAPESISAHPSYAPAVEAVHQLIRGDDGKDVEAILHARAPSWLPLLALPHPEPGRPGHPWPMTPTMRREFAGLVEVMAADQPLVIVLEDLQWSDHATVDLLGELAEQDAPTRFLLVATYRPAEATARHHPVAAAATALEARHLCSQVRLTGLDWRAIAEYVQQRLGPAEISDDITAFLAERTEGHPVLLSGLMDHLLITKRFIEHPPRWSLAPRPRRSEDEIPDDLVAVVNGLLRSTTAAERDLLDAACVAGKSFDVREVAAALGVARDEVERRCEAMSRHQLLIRFVGERRWPDGSNAGTYVFGHDIVREGIYAALAPAKRAELHQRIGLELERGYAGHTQHIATKLARHFEQGRDHARAVIHFDQCARDAYGRGALHDTAANVDSALAALAQLPSAPERDRKELELRRLLALVLADREGHATERARRNLTRAQELCQRTDDGAALCDVLYGIASLHTDRSHLARARAAAGRAQQVPEAFAPWRADYSLGVIALWTGDLSGAEQRLVTVEARPVTAEPGMPWLGVEPSVGARVNRGLGLWIAERFGAAHKVQREATTLAHRLNHPLTSAQVMTFDAVQSLLESRWTDAARSAARALSIAREHEFPRWLGTALACRGRALVALDQEETGLRELREGLELVDGAGLRLGGSLLGALHADALREVGRLDDALRVVESSLKRCGAGKERLFETELWRLKGELLSVRGASQGDVSEAATCLERARAIARRLGMTAFERRADRSLARWRDR